MNWKFWKRDAAAKPLRQKRLARPKEPPQAVGRKLVVDLKLDPDEAWALRHVSRPSKTDPDVRDFRLYDPLKASQTGLHVKDWYSLDDQTDLILFEGRIDTGGWHVDIWPMQESAA
jgi:hypothetical protein